MVTENKAKFISKIIALAHPYNEACVIISMTVF